MKPSLSLDTYAEALNCVLEKHSVVTLDGFVLDLKRVKWRDGDSSIVGPPVLLLPGLLQTSGTYLVGTNSLAMHLLRSGFDVWLGNNRSGKHVSFSTYHSRVWDWDVTDMAQNDIPALLNSINTLRKDTTPVSIIAHSQATTQCIYLLNSSIPLLNLGKIVLLAPAVYMGPLFYKLPFISFMRSLPDKLFNAVFGPTAFMPMLMHLGSLLGHLPGYGTLSYSVFATIFHWDDHLWDKRIRNHLFMSSPSYVSTKTIKWWLHGGDEDEESEPISNIIPIQSPPILAIVAGNDLLVDGERFLKLLHNHHKSIIIEEYAHLDVLWAYNVIDKVGRPIVDFLNT
ncbi:hypothetical protein CANINC_000721 [Pichia inconspicua]|uniref:Partial AB-hydrolase lipase domain-containing protein n=1 Tax=Pichia inconspicua TaxID=52247 RepID=A0A4T0X659_9ASCO|nr:hypothetical protein CANINC_000721 [[Candida] inconspicua]